MAGTWKDFVEGELVSETELQNIQDSIAFIYASESAANTALTSKVDGTQFYDTTANKLKIWSGSSWDAVGGGGKILQVVTTGALTGNSTTGYQLEATAASYSDVPGFTVNITPAATSSKVLAIASIQTWGTDSAGRIKIIQDASGSFADALISPSLSSSTAGGAQHSLVVVISPSTTSAFTVKLQGYSNQDGGSNRFRINWYESQGTLTLIEIGA